MVTINCVVNATVREKNTVVIFLGFQRLIKQVEAEIGISVSFG